MTTIRARFGTPRKTPAPKPVSRAARQLALAHHIEQQVEGGTLADYAAAARSLGLTRARLTQVMNLLLLAPEVQNGILLGHLKGGERSLRRLSPITEWERQVKAFSREN